MIETEESSIINTFLANHWEESFSLEEQVEMLHALETGQVLFFPNLSFDLEKEEQKFLSADYVNKKTKNISYQSAANSLKGACGSAQELSQIKMMLARFSEQAVSFVMNVFPQYKNSLKIARTSFRPAEISNRNLSYRKDDTRLHVDAFPSSPNQGQRILRVFANINMQGQPRVWRLGEPFEKVARRFLPQVSKPFLGSRLLLNFFNITKSLRTEYDHIMLQLHDLMKKDLQYQQQVSQEKFDFPSNTTWIVQTDHVSHAAMSGQHVLEQTFYLPVEAMMNPNLSPLRILESLMGKALV